MACLQATAFSTSLRIAPEETERHWAHHTAFVGTRIVTMRAACAAHDPGRLLMEAARVRALGARAW